MSIDSSFEDIPAIVIDTGSFMCRGGFAGDDAPRSVFQNVIGRTRDMYEDWMSGLYGREAFIGDEVQNRRDVLALNYPVRHGIVTNWDDMEKIWHHIFQKELHVDSENHPVLLTEAPLNPKSNREKMIEIMFESFNTPAFHVTLPAVLSMYASGRGSGIMFDCGHGVSHVIPIYEGHAFKHAFQRLNFGGGDLTDYMTNILNNERCLSFSYNSDKEVVRDIKEKQCYVAQNFQDEMKTADGNSYVENLYELPDGRRIILGSERFRCVEPLFQPSLLKKDFDGVHTFIHSSLMKADIDTRRDLMCNVILSGSSTMFPGFVERLRSELENLVPKTARVKVVAAPEIKFSVWIGGSILGSLSLFQQHAVSRQEYEENGPGIAHIKCL